MLPQKEKKHYIFKILIVLIVLFLGVIAVKDFTPVSHKTEKEIPNNIHGL